MEKLTKLRDAILELAEASAEVVLHQHIDEGYEAEQFAQTRAYRAADALDEVLEELFGDAANEMPTNDN